MLEIGLAVEHVGGNYDRPHPQRGKVSIDEADAVLAVERDPVAPAQPAGGQLAGDAARSRVQGLVRDVVDRIRRAPVAERRIVKIQYGHATVSQEAGRNRIKGGVEDI